MKMRFCVCMVLIAVAQFALLAMSSSSIYRTGAEAKVTFRIVDDEAKPVSNAVAHVWFCSDDFHQNDADWEEVSGADGLITVTHKTNYKLVCRISKDGYYESKDTIVFPKREGEKLNVVDGKWQPYGEMRTVVLKKIKNPIRLRDPEARYRYKYPESGKWAGFDLVCGDWVPPLGNGKCEDVMIRYIREQRQDGYFKSLDISFTNNPYAGAYLMNKDSFSEMDSVYEADTNGVYVGCLRYEFERTAKGNHTISELGPGQYLVFRIRAKTDDDGNLVSAHYGRIMGALQYLEKGGLVLGPVYFNPTPNDTNLEDAEAVRLSLLRRRQESEREQRNCGAGVVK